MKIKHFKATNVNGYLEFDIDFFDELTFLIGINGSGKTTALRLILGLLNPSWTILNQICFDYLELELVHNDNQTYTITAQTSDNSIELSIKQLDIKPCKFQKIDIPNFPFSISTFESRHLISNYLRQEQIFSKYPIVKKIQEFPTPIFLGIDRRIYEGREIDSLNIENIQREKDLTKPFKGSFHESLKEIENLIIENYLEFTNDQNNIRENLKNNIIQSMFELLDEKQIETSIKTKAQDLLERKRMLEKAAIKINVPGIKEKLNEYFQSLEDIQQRLLSKTKASRTSNNIDMEELKIYQSWFINFPHLQRIDKIIGLFEFSEEETKRAYSQFTKFEKLANGFLEESNKKIQIGSNGELMVCLPDLSISNLYRLSSGEKQILVMLAQLIFRENKKTEGSIFIIDEPEISLHLEWQELFVKSIKAASPNTQFILATHSPTIIGELKNQKFCQDLSKLNIK